MESLRQIGVGFLLAVISMVVVLGGFTLATAEGRIANSTLSTEPSQLPLPSSSPVIPTQIIVPSPTPISTPIPTDTFTPTNTLTPIVTLTPTVKNSPTRTPLPTLTGIPTNTQRPTSSACPVPSGWIAIVVQDYDTVASIAKTYQMAQSAILQANCLSSDQLQAGRLLYVLPRPTATQRITSIPCGAPYGWVNYYVVPGDTLYSIGLRYGVLVGELQRANCLGNSTYIQVGRSLQVPNVATIELLTTPTDLPPATFEVEISPTVEPPTVIPDVPTATVAPEVPSPTIEPTAIPELPTAPSNSGEG